MPPFPAKLDQQKYAHANTLTQHEIDEIADWVNNFAPLGDAGNIPTPPTYHSNYQLEDPDLVLQIPAYTVNTVNDRYRLFALPMNNATQKFIRQIELVPGNRNIVHHVLVFQDTSKTPFNMDMADPEPGYSGFGGTGSPTSRLLWGYTPGQRAFEYPPGFGGRVNPNSYIILQIHYPGGISNEVDGTQIRIKFGAGVNFRNIVTQSILNYNTTLVNGPLVIPANEIRTFNNQFTVNNNVIVTGIMPHMHLIGRQIKSFFVNPQGDTTMFVDIPDWDFHWQGVYRFRA